MTEPVLQRDKQLIESLFKHQVKTSNTQQLLQELEEIGDLDIKLRDEGKLSNENLLTLANMLEVLFSKDINLWDQSPMQFFHHFLDCV